MGAVGPVGVVVVAPVLDDHPGFQERVEAPRVEQLVAQSAVEGFDPGVLPRRAGVDEQRSGAVESTPVVDRMGDELRTVFEAHVAWRAELKCQVVRDVDDAVGVDAAIDFDGQRFAGELVDDVEHFQGAEVSLAFGNLDVAKRSETEGQPEAWTSLGQFHVRR